MSLTRCPKCQGCRIQETVPGEGVHFIEQIRCINCGHVQEVNLVPNYRRMHQYKGRKVVSEDAPTSLLPWTKGRRRGLQP